MKPTFHSLIISDVRNETEDTVSIAFELPEDLKELYHYQSGQYLTLKANVDGEEIRRSYSLCSAPFEKELRVAIKRVENGKFSNYANSKLSIGDSMEVMTPSGHFTTELASNKKRNFALFAAGSGVTPIFSLVKSILNNEPDSDVTLFYGNKGFASIIFREELEAMKNLHMDRFRVVHVLSRESLGNTIQKGRINLEKVQLLNKAFLNGVEVHEVFVCGPEEMIHAVKDTFIEQGLDKNAIHFELFGTTTASQAATKKENPKRDDLDSYVTVILDGDHVEIDLNTNGINILDAAQLAGADLPYACKGGVCCTCKARILEGTAMMDINYALDAEEVAAGYILTCQAHPTSKKLIVSFDD